MILDILFPLRCIICKSKVQNDGALCTECFKSIHFITYPYCAICGTPFPYNVGPGALCGKCMADPPPYNKARAVFIYNEHSAKLVTDFKYGDKLQGYKHFGRWMEERGSELLEKCDMLVPVPLHRRRFFDRRYNQSALLCHAIRRFSGVKVIPDMLIRRKNTVPQTTLPKQTRQKNVANAFILNKRYSNNRYSPKGKSITIVDDVMTTGATIKACAKILKRAGASNVFVLTLGMTPNEEL